MIRQSAARRSLSHLLALRFLGLLALACNIDPGHTAHAAVPTAGHVIVILMENHDWSTIRDVAKCPYINRQLLPKSCYAEQYYNPPTLHPSEPNYLWLVAGTNFGITNDKSPATNTRNTTNHLAWQLDAAGLPWKAYAEGISGTDIPLTNNGAYAVRHVPFLYFKNINTNLPYVLQHVRPFHEFAADLTNGALPAFSFITPNLTNDMHNLTTGSDSTRRQGDTWLSKEVPAILNSAVFKQDGLLIITWDEGTEAAGGLSGDGPIGCIVLSPNARGGGYHNTVHYTHSDTLRTIQDALQLRPYLGDAAHATGLDDFFVAGRVPLELTDAEVVADHFHLLVHNCIVGRTYGLQGSNLITGGWQTLTSLPADSDLLAIGDPDVLDPARYYRVVEAP